jgi:hypothetical protein
MSLTLTEAELRELTGYKRGKEQARWLKNNGFKFRLDKLGKPRVDRGHYNTKMGSTSGARVEPASSEPNWSAMSA